MRLKERIIYAASPIRRMLVICSMAIFIIGYQVCHVTAGLEEPLSGSPDPDKSRPLPIDRWLLLGPVPSPLPAFHEENEKAKDTAFLLSFERISPESLRPVNGGREILTGAAETAWKTIEGDTGGVSIQAGTGETQEAYLAVYVEVPRWMEIDIEARSTHPYDISVAGESVLKCDKPGHFEEKKSGKIKLERGKHALLVKTVYALGDTVTAWRIDVRIGADDMYEAHPSVSITPARHLSLTDILMLHNVRDVNVSPGGDLAALSMERFASPGGERERWVEIRDTRDGKVLQTMKDIPGISNVRWAPSGNRLSYKTTTDGKSTVRVVDIDTGTSESIIEDVEDMGGYSWGGGGSYIIYSITEKPEEDKSGVKRLRGIYDRWSYGRNRSRLYICSFPGGSKRKLTDGRHNSYLASIHPDGKSVLITRNFEDLSSRPYSRTELMLINLEDNGAERLCDVPWLRGAQWSPCGGKILILAGPSVFGGRSESVPAGTMANDYDTQAYIFDPDRGGAESITRAFAPSIKSALWSRTDGNIYFIGEDRSYRRLYRYNPRKKTFTAIDTDTDYITDFHIALDNPTAAVVGERADGPKRVYMLDLKGKGKKLILDTAESGFGYIEMGEIEDWSFESEGGRIIEGRIYYPPGFDASGEYPCIVYYYGGTSPTSRHFGGRYPKNLWASMGYVVYVLQPSGATGYGQEFSADHVNDWGKVVAGEIIEGVGKFLDSHRFVDRDRVGCIGASYGGFMTQLIITKTDIFSAAVSHAGISSITSYWGEGYWGYSYNAVAAANSFPWNRPDIYIDQSPIFSADRISTPLLLLHGASDTNVPRGESEQMYTALKLLGKNVEYVRFSGQNHFIVDYEKRIAWSNAIVAWFDRWLKGQPEWWNDMYPVLEPEKSVAIEDIGMQSFEVVDWGTVLFGKIEWEDIMMKLPEWVDEYHGYEPDGELLEELEKRIGDVRITVVLGSWCSDSRQEIPRLWKLLETLNFPVHEIEMYGVGSSRFTDEMPFPPGVLDWSTDLKSRYGVERVATIIISRQGVEIGRIIEAPMKSLEIDLLEILRR